MSSANTQLSPLSLEEQALKDRIEKFNQLPEVKGEELVDQYLTVQTTASVIKSAVDVLQQTSQSADQLSILSEDTKKSMIPEIELASQHLQNQASDFLTSCKKYVAESSNS